MPHKDLERRTEQNKKDSAKYYAANKDAIIARKSDRRRENVAWVREYKVTRGCADCGKNHPAILQFHHLDRATKDKMWVGDSYRGWSRERLLKELEGCIVLCANCHFVRHWNEVHPSGS